MLICGFCELALMPLIEYNVDLYGPFDVSMNSNNEAYRLLNVFESMNLFFRTIITILSKALIMILYNIDNNCVIIFTGSTMQPKPKIKNRFMRKLVLLFNMHLCTSCKKGDIFGI